MHLFPHGHATHPQWQMAAGLVLAQLRAQMALPDYAKTPALGLLYITDHYAADAAAILDLFSTELPQVGEWAGAVAVGVLADQAEYMDEPAIAALLCDLPPEQFRVFSGVAPLPAPVAGGFAAHTALVHADAAMTELPALLGDLADRTASGYLFGGLASSRARAQQFAISGNGNLRGQGTASGVFAGGMSGVAFAEGVSLVSRVTQGCQPVGQAMRVTEVQGNVLLELDGRPALDVLLETLQVTLDAPEQAFPALRATLVGLAPEGADDAIDRSGHFGTGVTVRHIIGLDKQRGGVAIADHPQVGDRIAFCRRDPQAARADLLRICAEIREALEPEEMAAPLAAALAAGGADAAPHPARRMAGAVYVSCVGRGGGHFGGASAEMRLVRHALGDVPLVGFFAGGEIARRAIYGYTGVLTVFTTGP